MATATRRGPLRGGAGRFGRVLRIRATRGLALAMLALVAMPGSTAAGPTPPPGLSAAASFVPVTQYLGDGTGVVYAFTIHNTGSLAIGAVAIARPSSVWGVAACPDGPAGWAVKRSGKACRYQSAAGSGDDLAAGASSSDFQVRATTGTALADQVGDWQIAVSISNKFDASSVFRPA